MYDLSVLKKHAIAVIALFFIAASRIYAQSDSIIYCFDRYRAYIDSICFPATGKGIKVRDYNPYNYLTDLQDAGRTTEGNIAWSRQAGKPFSLISAHLPVLDSCQADSMYSHTHVFTDGRNFTCIGYTFILYRGGIHTDLYSTIVVFNRRGEVSHRLLHLRGSVLAPCVDEDGNYLTFARSIQPSCKFEENTGSCCIYSLRQDKMIYDFRTYNDWNNIYLTDGYIGLMTLPDEEFKRYRVFDFREKLYYDMKIPYEQVAKIKRVTRNGFLMKERNGETHIVPYRDFAAPEKFPD